MFIEQPARWLRWLYPRALWRMDPNEHAVYLTFDDGPIPQSTPFLLETLRQFDIKATFFLVGDNVRRNPELFKQILEEGHEVGNHTYNHLGAFKHWAATYIVNALKAEDIIHSNLFRPPHGTMRWSEYFWITRKRKLVMWDVVTRDYSKWMTADDVIENVKRYTRNGSIITFHDSLKSIDKLHYALPESIKWLKSQGYEFKTIQNDWRIPRIHLDRLLSGEDMTTPYARNIANPSDHK